MQANRRLSQLGSQVSQGVFGFVDNVRYGLQHSITNIKTRQAVRKSGAEVLVKIFQMIPAKLVSVIITNLTSDWHSHHIQAFSVVLNELKCFFSYIPQQ